MYLSKTSGKVLPRSLLWIVAGFLLAASVVAHYIYRGYHAQLKHATQLTRDVATLTANNFSTVFAFNDAALMYLAQEAAPALASGSIRNSLREIMAAPHFKHYAARAPEAKFFYVFDAKGRLVASTAEDAERSLPLTIDDRAYFHELQDPSITRMTISDVLISRISQQPAIVLARGIWNKSHTQFLGVVLTQLSLDYLVQLISHLDLGEHAVTMIRRDDSGLMLARHPFLQESINQPLTPHELRIQTAIQRGERSGTLDCPDPIDGAPRITSYADLAHYPIYVSVAMSYADSLASWRIETIVSSALLLSAAALTAFGYIRLERTKLSLEQKTRQAYKLSAMVEQCPVAMAVYDPAGIAEYVNPMFRQMAGLGHDHDLGPKMHLVDSVITDDTTRTAIQEAIGAGHTWSGVVASCRMDTGGYYWQSLLVAPIRDEHGHICYYLSVGQDITEQYMAQQALAEREHMLSAIYDASSVAIFMVDKDLKISRLNRAMASLFERELESMIGMDYLTLVQPEQQHLSAACLASIVKGTTQATYVERQYLRSDGSAFWGDIGCRRLSAPDGTFAGLVAVLVDITDRKQVYGELNSYRTRLGALLADRQQKIEAISDDISHSLETADPEHMDEHLTKPITASMASLAAGLLEGLGENAPSDVLVQLGELVGHLKDILDEPEPSIHTPRDL